MSFTESDRKFRSNDGNKFPFGSGEAGGTSFTVAIAAALKRAYGGRHSAVKIVAGAVGANERAVRNWFEAKNGPNGEHLVRLISHSDEMLDSVLAMAGKRDFAAALEIAKAKHALERALAELAKLESEASGRRRRSSYGTTS
jgi:hypothetical protein